jgi:anti-anti-sigma factor
MYSAREFFDGIAGKMAEGWKRICLDLGAVRYLDSSGVGAIIKIVQRSKEQRIDLRFRGITGTPRKVLTMSNILSIMTEEIAAGGEL